MYVKKRTFPKVDKDMLTTLPALSFTGLFDMAIIKMRPCVVLLGKRYQSIIKHDTPTLVLYGAKN